MRHFTRFHSFAAVGLLLSLARPAAAQSTNYSNTSAERQARFDAAARDDARARARAPIPSSSPTNTPYRAIPIPTDLGRTVPTLTNQQLDELQRQREAREAARYKKQSEEYDAWKTARAPHEAAENYFRQLYSQYGLHPKDMARLVDMSVDEGTALSPALADYTVAAAAYQHFKQTAATAAFPELVQDLEKYLFLYFAAEESVALLEQRFPAEKATTEALYLRVLPTYFQLVNPGPFGSGPYASRFYQNTVAGQPDPYAADQRVLDRYFAITRANPALIGPLLAACGPQQNPYLLQLTTYDHRYKQARDAKRRKDGSPGGGFEKDADTYQKQVLAFLPLLHTFPHPGILQELNEAKFAEMPPEWSYEKAKEVAAYHGVKPVELLLVYAGSQTFGPATVQEFSPKVDKKNAPVYQYIRRLAGEGDATAQILTEKLIAKGYLKK